jgi:hypothetical protein
MWAASPVEATSSTCEQKLKWGATVVEQFIFQCVSGIEVISLLKCTLSCGQPVFVMKQEQVTVHPYYMPVVFRIIFTRVYHKIIF